MPAKNSIELMIRLDKGGAFAQPFQFFGSGIGAGAAEPAQQI